VLSRLCKDVIGFKQFWFKVVVNFIRLTINTSSTVHIVLSNVV
jgi:hypothetical protein